MDADECADLIESCDIDSFPTFFFYSNGTKVDEIEGADPDLLEQKLMDYSSKIKS